MCDDGKLPDCPNCGENSFVVNGVASGLVQRWYNEHGKFEPSDLGIPPIEWNLSVIYCAECGEVRQDVVLNRYGTIELKGAP